jgi:ribonuclease HII
VVTIGIDEVGRGSWAGPLVVGAVILDAPIDGLMDSKKLTAQRRQQLAEIIKKKAAAVGLGWVEPAEIDRLGLTKATRLGISRALAQIHTRFDEIIIDGSVNFLADDHRAKAVIKADDSVQAVSAASIIAKVARDLFMTEAATEYPEYGFEKHVGYGTAGHLSSIKLHGTCKLHRLSYKPVRAQMVLISSQRASSLN